MTLTEKDASGGKEKGQSNENGFLKAVEPSLSVSNSTAFTNPIEKSHEGKDALGYANVLRSRNKFVEALGIYESILEKDNKNVEAHIGKGICLQMQNMGKQSFESFSEAVKLDPQNPCALTHCGILYKDEGRLVEAAESYRKALGADPSYKPAAECLSIVLTDIGTSLKLAGNTQEGIQNYYDAIKIDPHYAPAYYNLGVVYSEMMQYDAALNCYEKAALERPMYAEAYCNMGVIYKNRGDLESAITCYERCLAVSPNFEIAKNNMAIALTDLGTKVKLEGDINQGVAYYKKALYYNWHYADAMYNLGVAYGEMLKFEMAIVFYELAFHFNPHCAEACNNLGVIYKDRDNLDKAVECYQLALSIKPNFSQSLNNLGVVYTVQGKMDAAASMIEKAIVANPTYAEAYNNLGVLYRDAGSISLAIEAYEQCLKIDPDSRNAGQNRLLAMNYINEGTDDKLFEAHRDWGWRFMRLYPQYTSWDNSKDPERPIVIGYVSPDYFTHSVSYFIEAPLFYHDYVNYKVIVYSAVVKADAKTYKFRDIVLKRGGIWRDIYGIDEKKVASMVREDKVDILVELTGHTANNKLGMMACRPAPLQVTWIGYPNTTGLPTIDYRITDALADPPDTKQKNVEDLVSPPEAMCHIFSFPHSHIHPAVLALQLHLPNKQMVRFRDDDIISEIVDRERDKRTMLIVFFDTNIFDVTARRYLYKDFPKNFTWNSSKRCWNNHVARPQRGRIVSANPAEWEMYNLRLLLSNIKGPSSYDDLCTVNGVKHATFRKAALKVGIIENDDSLSQCLTEASLVQFSSSLRRLFVTIMIFCEPGDICRLWNEHFDSLSEDHRL